MRRFIRGLLWGGVLGAALAIYLRSGEGEGSPDGTHLRGRTFRQEPTRDDTQTSGGLRASPVQLALDAGRAAVDATLAFLGLRS